MRRRGSSSLDDDRDKTPVPPVRRPIIGEQIAQMPRHELYSAGKVPALVKEQSRYGDVELRPNPNTPHANADQNAIANPVRSWAAV